MLEGGRASELIKLVTRKDDVGNQPDMEGPYVTLSHRWGRKPFLKLTRQTLRTFFDGIPLSTLPCTFQDVIKVTCELGLRWLWIDALCIIQEDDGLRDWLEESASMEKVYANSYCNISATAAMDSSEGLFSSRDTNWNWVETVTLNTKDIREGTQENVSCTILDPFFWPKYVDDAPVNRRSWVYQERLLAPRVLHWCRDQIAFECREGNRAECRPDELPHFRLRSGTLVDDVRLKSVDIEAGKQLRVIREGSSNSSMNPSRLARMVDEVDGIFHLYELWKHWVQVYSKMELTNSQDRLIALSGIARMMTTRMEEAGIRDKYIAGMWQNYMASQLLWFVNEGLGADRQPFQNTRPATYRAPTFSWASVETPRGITFPETTDQGLLVQVEVVRLTYRTAKDRFGLLTDGYIVLRGILRKIELTDHVQARRPPPTKFEAFVSVQLPDQLLLTQLDSLS